MQTLCVVDCVYTWLLSVCAAVVMALSQRVQPHSSMRQYPIVVCSRALLRTATPCCAA